MGPHPLTASLLTAKASDKQSISDRCDEVRGCMPSTSGKPSHLGTGGFKAIVLFCQLILPDSV